VTPWSCYTWTRAFVRTAYATGWGITHLDNNVLTLQLVLGFILPIAQLHLNSGGFEVNVLISAGWTLALTHVSGSPRLR